MVISIDPGEKMSGISVIMLSSGIPVKSELIGFNVENRLVVSKIRKYYVKYGLQVVIEDIQQYRAKVSAQVISTCKFIGELDYRLRKELKTVPQYVTRGQVKKWVFEAFPGLCVEKIDSKIAYADSYGERTGKRRYINKDGKFRKATFHWVDDRIVISAMKELWGIPTPKPGKKNVFGFSDHSWQALACGSYWLAKCQEKHSLFPQTFQAPISSSLLSF